MDRSGILLASTRRQGWAVLPCRTTSRFRPPGQEKQRADLRKRLSGEKNLGVFLTLTLRRPATATVHQTCRVTKHIWRRWKLLRDRLNAERRRRGLPRLEYVCTLEFTKAGWPHLHAWFPGLKFLAPQAALAAAWRGHVWVTLATGSAAGYVTKYLAKAGSHAPLLWRSGAKAYACSQSFYTRKKPPTRGDWLPCGLVSAYWLATAEHLTLPGLAVAALKAVARRAELDVGCWTDNCLRPRDGPAIA